jgi:hypothetical protein
MLGMTTGALVQGHVTNLWLWNIAELRATNLAAAVKACLG